MEYEMVHVDDYNRVKAYLIGFGFNEDNVEQAMDDVFRIARQTGIDALETAKRCCANIGKPRF
jgi:hypothetical protein